MKHQYFGDVNDYRKYGLLRALQSETEHRLLVAWMLTPDDGGPDGSRRSYLDEPAKWKSYDPELFDGLTTSRIGTRHSWAFRTAHVLFLLAAQDRHAETLDRGLSRSLPRWQGQIEKTHARAFSR